MKYSDEQLRTLSENFKNDALGNVFNALIEAGEQGLNMREIGERAGLGTFARDKAIFALEFAGLVSKKDIWSAKIYAINEEGERLQEVLERESEKNNIE